MNKRGPKLAAALLAATFSFSGCYGSFPATRTLYNWNGDASDNKLVQSLLFVALVIIPVYEVFAIADALVLNVIEFWTGNSPDIAEMQEQADGSVIVVRGDQRWLVVPDAAGGFRIEIDGRVVAYAERGAGGEIFVSDVDRERTVAVLAADVGALAAALGPRVAK